MTRTHWLSAMLCAGCLIPCLAIRNPQSAILNAQDIPVIGQPTADYYGARGTGVKVTWTLDRDSVPEDGVIVATLTVTGADNPRDITRPDLKKLPEFHDRFTITDNSDPP